MEHYAWPLVSEFLDRADDLEHLEDWWGSPERTPLALVGRRRVGKSWLFRRFANGKHAVLLVAEQLPIGTQLTRFADILEPVLGIRPDLPDLSALIRAVYRAARMEKVLVVIDEFPWLLGGSSAEVRQALTSVQAVMEEERDTSKVKLVLCGSHIGQMNALFGEQNPMHGRLIRADIRPLPFGEAATFLRGHDPVTAFERYAVTGGMPLYLGRLAKGSVREAVCSQILDRNGSLWNEGRCIVEQELREPRVYFGILEQLASGEKELNEITQALRMERTALIKYLSTLVELRIVRRRAPLGAAPTSRSGHWQLVDPFLRFWFRFVFPFQDGLESGLCPGDLYDAEVAPALPDHVAPVFEEWCRSWLRANHGRTATTIGVWWGNAANQFRKSSERSSEEIDAVGTLRNQVTLVAECKWTSKPLGRSIISELETYKIPALREGGFRIPEQPTIVLFAKSGYTRDLRSLAEEDDRIQLVDVPAALPVATFIDYRVKK
jgi:AAA+ ATPase superfamily predicted ATPase